MDKGAFIRDFTLNSQASGIFAVCSAEQCQSKNGPFWRLALSDVSGTIAAVIWAPLSNEFPEINASTLAECSGRVASYRNEAQYILDRFKPLDKNEAAKLDLSLFMASSPYNSDAMFSELKTLCLQEFNYKPLRKLVLAILNNSEINEIFKNSPAARAMHHAYAGGLLEHTLSVFKLCQAIASHYPIIDREMLLAGALFHDLGKIRELSGGVSTEYTEEGKLLGHISLGLELLLPVISHSGLESCYKNHLIHLILSHHGRHDYGSPVLPQTAEAMALHYADDLDAKMAIFQRLFEGSEEDASAWTPWQKSLERPLFKAAHVPAPQKDERKKLTQEEQCLSLLRE